MKKYRKINARYFGSEWLKITADISNSTEYSSYKTTKGFFNCLFHMCICRSFAVRNVEPQGGWFSALASMVGTITLYNYM